MSNTTKSLSQADEGQVLKGAFNDVDDTLSVNGFIVGKVGRKITLTAHSATEDDFEFLEGSTSLYIIRVTYTNAAHGTLASVERIS